MSKAKTASKNNPTTREQAKEYFLNGKLIKAVKIITEKSTFVGAEYHDTLDPVLDANGSILPWDKAKNLV